MDEYKLNLTDEQIQLLDNIIISGIIPNEINKNTIGVIAESCFSGEEKYLQVLITILSDTELLTHYRENKNGMKFIMKQLMDSIHNFMLSNGNSNNNNKLNLQLKVCWMCGAVKGATLYKINNDLNFIQLFDDFLSFILNRNKREESILINSVLMNIYTAQVLQNNGTIEFLEKTLGKFGVLEEYAEMDDILFYEYQTGLSLMLFTMISTNEFSRYRAKVQHSYTDFFNFVLKRVSVLREAAVSFEKLIEPIRLDFASLPLFIHMLEMFLKCEQLNLCNQIFDEFCHSLLLFQGRQTLLATSVIDYLMNPAFYSFIGMPWYTSLLLKTTNDPLHFAMISSNVKLREEVFKTLIRMQIKDVSEPFILLSLFYLHTSTENGLYEYMVFVNNSLKENIELANVSIDLLTKNVFKVEDVPNVKEDFYKTILEILASILNEETLGNIFELLRAVWKNYNNQKLFNPFIKEFGDKLMELKKWNVFIVKELIKSFSSSSVDDSFAIDTISLIHYPKLLPLVITFLSLKACPLDLFSSVQKLLTNYDLNLYYFTKYCSLQLIQILNQNDQLLIGEQINTLLENILLFSSTNEAGNELIKSLEFGKQKNCFVKLLYKLLSTQSKKPISSLHFVRTPILYNNPLSISFKSTTINFCFSYSPEPKIKQCLFNFSSDGNSLSLYLDNDNLVLFFNENAPIEMKISFDFAFKPKLWYSVFLNFEFKGSTPNIHFIIYSDAIDPVFDQTIGYKLRDNSLNSSKNYIGGALKSQFPFWGQMSFFSIYSLCLSPTDITLIQSKGLDSSENPQINKRIFHISPQNMVKDKGKYFTFLKSGKTPQTVKVVDIKVCHYQSLQISLHQANFFSRFFYFVRNLDATQFIEVFKSNARANNPLYLLLTLITRCIIGSAELKEDFIKMDGVTILQSILSKSIPVFVIPAVFDQLQKLSEYFIKEKEIYNSFQSIMLDFRLWIPFSFTFQKYVLQKIVVLNQNNSDYFNYLSNLLILYYQPEFPSNLKLHGNNQRNITTKEVDELRSYIWHLLASSIKPNKESLQPLIDTLKKLKDDTIFLEGINLLLKNIDFSIKWVEIFEQYLCNELVGLLFKCGNGVKEVILETISKFLEIVDAKFPYFQMISQGIQESVILEGIFTIEELRKIQQFPIKATELLNTQQIYLNVFQYSTEEVSDKLLTFWLSQNHNLIPICNGKEINFNIIESLIAGVKGDPKKLKIVGMLIKRGLNKEVIRNYENIARMYVLLIKVDESIGEFSTVPEFLFEVCKALKDKKNEKGNNALVSCTNLFLSKTLQTNSSKLLTVESIIPFLEKIKEELPVKIALRKLRIIKTLQITENTDEVVKIKDSEKEVIAMYGVYCMDRIIAAKNGDVRERLIQLFLNISKGFYEELAKEIKNYQNANDLEKEEMIELLQKGKSTNIEGIINGIVFSKVRRILSSYASNILLQEEEYRSVCNQEINLIASMKKDKELKELKEKELKEKELKEKVVITNMKKSFSEDRIEQYILKLNHEIESSEIIYTQFDDKMKNEQSGSEHCE